MMIASLLVALALQSAAADQQQPGASPVLELNDTQRSDLRCAATFAVVAGGQNRGEPWAASYPPMEPKAKHYFIETAIRVRQETGQQSDTIHTILSFMGKDISHGRERADDEQVYMDALMQPCLDKLAAFTPQPETETEEAAEDGAGPSEPQQ